MSFTYIRSLSFCESLRLQYGIEFIQLIIKSVYTLPEQKMLIQNVIFLMNTSSKYVLDLFPSFCIGVDNNNFYFYDTHHLEDILIVF